MQSDYRAGLEERGDQVNVDIVTDYVDFHTTFKLDINIRSINYCENVPGCLFLYTPANTGRAYQL